MKYLTKKGKECALSIVIATSPPPCSTIASLPHFSLGVLLFPLIVFFYKVIKFAKVAVIKRLQ